MLRECQHTKESRTADLAPRLDLPTDIPRRGRAPAGAHERLELASRSRARSFAVSMAPRRPVRVTIRIAVLTGKLVVQPADRITEPRRGANRPDRIVVVHDGHPR